MGARERLLVRRWPDADDKFFTYNAAAHMSINHERESTEHPSFFGRAFFRQNVTDSLG